jgi:hypothetical protein
MAQKQALCARYNVNPNQKPTQEELQNWHYQQYGHSICQPTVSEILSKEWERLDEVDRDELLKRPVKQVRGPMWPELEDALNTWVTRVEDEIEISYPILITTNIWISVQTPLSGDLIAEAAKELWAGIPAYQGKPLPTFSDGWLSGFK